MTTANSKEYLDHPNPNAGYWMEVLGANTDGGTVQILRRNTGVANNETYIRIVKKDGTATEWDMIDSWRCKNIPESITDLKEFRQKGTYYMTSADSGRYSDHPMPGVAGWFLEVSPLDHSENHFCQILRRNTSDNKNMLVYYRQVQRNSEKELIATDWMNTFSITTDSVSSVENLLSSIIKPGEYYMTTVEANGFTDHPEVNTTAGWFLEVSKSSSSGYCTQVMKKNVTIGSSMAMYYRNVASDGKVSPWANLLNVDNEKALDIPVEILNLHELKESGQYYMTTAQANTYPDLPEVNTTAGWFLEVSRQSSSGHVYQILRKNVTTESSMAIYYRNVMASGTFSVWKSMIPTENTTAPTREEVVLWKGVSKGDFSTNFKLLESIKNFDSIYIQVDSDAGKNVTDRTILMSQWSSNECQFVFHNLSNTSGNLDFWLFEYAVMFNTEGTTFKNSRSTRLKMAEDGTKTRTDSDKTIGVVSIVGIRN